MKLGIIGLSSSGKSTIFAGLTNNNSVMDNKTEGKLETTTVPVARVDKLNEMFNPKKTTFAQVTFYYPGKGTGEKSKDSGIWNRVRDCDALIHVVRNFDVYGMDAPNPVEDFQILDQELIISDLMVVEKKLEKLETEGTKGKFVDSKDLSLLQKCKKVLENEEPLRKHPELATAPELKGFTFLSSKPTLVLFNNDDDNETAPSIDDFKENWMIIRGRIEQELSQMSPSDAQEFLEDYGISELAKDRAIKSAYELLGLISFFTVGEDEVKAWTIPTDTIAVEAANVIHSDIKKGFIRAEVVSYEHLIDAKCMTEAKKRGQTRLESKTYVVQNGDIINFRFNV